MTFVIRLDLDEIALSGLDRFQRRAEDSRQHTWVFKSAVLGYKPPMRRFYFRNPRSHILINGDSSGCGNERRAFWGTNMK